MTVPSGGTSHPQRHHPVEQEIVRAISGRNVLCFDYHGQPRQVNPHALGHVKPDNKAVLHAWQTGGMSNHGAPPLWGYFRLDEIQGLEVTDETFFGPQPNYKARFVNLIHSI
jgi:predicted DNA-binding transcriptional regulator YafY